MSGTGSGQIERGPLELDPANKGECVCKGLEEPTYPSQASCQALLTAVPPPYPRQKAEPDHRNANTDEEAGKTQIGS